MNSGPIIFLVILIGYISSLIYFNSKAKLGKNEHKALRNTITVVGLGFYGFVLLGLLIVAIGVIFFRQDFLPQ